MANSIGLASKYIALLDKVYKLGARTSVLDVAPDQVKAAADAGTFYVQKLALTGLGNYSKADGYPAGDATVTWESHAYSYDRGRKFSVDAVDEIEAMGVFGNVASEFIRVHVTPEIDAVRMSAIAGTSGISSASADLSTAADWVSALNTAADTLDEAEVPEDRWLLLISPTGLRLMNNAANTAATTDVLDRAQVVTVPLRRRHATVTLNAGATSGAGGYTMSGEHINFLLMDKSSCFADAKHSGIKYFTPAQNQSADAWMFQYRIYHDVFVYENKVTGIYAHTTANATNASTPTGTP